MTVTCEDGKKRTIGLRLAYASIRTEKALRIAIKNVIGGYRKQGWVSYADAIESKGIIEQLCLIGMISN